MKYIMDEKVQKKLSQIGFGGARLGTNYSEEESFKLLDTFFEGGGTLIDTARSYSPWYADSRGNSEKCIGRWLKKNNREKMVIVTKGGVRGEKGSVINISKEILCEEIEESLEALKTDYVDIYLLHKDDDEKPIEEVVDVLQLIKEKSGAKRIGVSNMKYERLYKAIKYAENNHLEAPTVLETWWSLAEYKKEMWNDMSATNMTADMYDMLLKKKMLCIAYTSQCKGYFQKMALEEEISDFLKMRIETERNVRKAQYIKNYCMREKVHPTAVVNGYITSNRLQGIALVSCSTQEQIKNIMNNCDYVLPQKVINEIDNM